MQLSSIRPSQSYSPIVFGIIFCILILIIMCCKIVSYNSHVAYFHQANMLLVVYWQLAMYLPVETVLRFIHINLALFMHVLNYVG